MKKLCQYFLSIAVVMSVSGCGSISHWFNSLSDNKTKPTPVIAQTADKKSSSKTEAVTKTDSKKIVEKKTLSKKDLDKKAFNSQFSGWLVDYTDMKEHKTASSGTSLLWVSPELKKGKYKAIMIDPIGLYPRPPLLARVSKGRMLEALNYIRDRAIKQIGSTLPIVDKAGPGVLRLDAAITGVNVPTDKDKMHDAKNTPVAMIFADISPAAAKQNQNFSVYLEARLRDSQTKKTLVKAVRAGTGNAVGSDKVTVDQMKPVLNAWVQDADTFIRENVK